MFSKYTSIWVLSAALLGACGGAVALPTRDVANARSAIRTAHEAGAREDPDAALHLTLASEQFEKAQRLAREGDGDRANLSLRRATADAELAIALIHQSDARDEAAEQGRQLRAFNTDPADTN